jgi:hypothetical protein
MRDLTADPLVARIGELLRLKEYLQTADLDLHAVRLYVADRLNQLYSPDYQMYRRRWQGCAPGAEPSPLLTFVEWHALDTELAQLEALASVVEEVVEETESPRTNELRRVLLLDVNAQYKG